MGWTTDFEEAEDEGYKVDEENPWWDEYIENWITRKELLKFDDFISGISYRVTRYKIVHNKRKKLTRSEIERWGEERAKLLLDETTYKYRYGEFLIARVSKLVYSAPKDMSIIPEEKVWEIDLSDKLVDETDKNRPALYPDPISIKIPEYDDYYIPLCYYKEEDALKATDRWLSIIIKQGRQDFLVFGIFRMGFELGLRKHPKFIEFLNEYMKSKDVRNFLKDCGKELKEDGKIYYDSKDEIFIYE